jgi:superfamily II DNA/RNA helicase
VLLPTRELAQQVGAVCSALARTLIAPPKVVVAHGGVSINPQLMALRGGAEVVIATPGRLLDLLAHRGLRLQALHTLVLDEADRLLEAGFAAEWAQIRQALPAGSDRRGLVAPPRARLQHLLFSATLPAEVQALAAGLGGAAALRIDLRSAGEIAAEADAAAAVSPGLTASIGSTAPTDSADPSDPDAPPASPSARPAITQRTLSVDRGRRTALLRHLLDQHPGWDRVLVFVASRYATELVAHKLERNGIHAAALHGELSQGARNTALGDFRARRLRVLVATDLAARGLDITDLPVVINYDLPRSPDDHTHRIGRTGRAGASGLAISFVDAASEAHMRLIEKRRGESHEREILPAFEPVETAVPPPVVTDGTGGIKGRRPSKKDKLRAAAAAASAATRSGG